MMTKTTIGDSIRSCRHPSMGHPNHSPLFYADERALVIGVRAMASLAVDYLSARPVSE